MREGIKTERYVTGTKINGMIRSHGLIENNSNLLNGI